MHLLISYRVKIVIRTTRGRKQCTDSKGFFKVNLRFIYTIHRTSLYSPRTRMCLTVCVSCRLLTFFIYLGKRSIDVPDIMYVFSPKTRSSCTYTVKTHITARGEW